MNKVTYDVSHQSLRLKENNLPKVLEKGRLDEDGVDMAYDYGDGCVVRNF